jgi:addiction module RelE/StbE family toxin
MIEIAFSPAFERAFRKTLKHRPNLADKFWQKVTIFMENPFDKRLRTHKLSGQLSTTWSFSIESDVRVIFYFVQDHQVMFIDIGKHEEVY